MVYRGSTDSCSVHSKEPRHFLTYHNFVWQRIYENGMGDAGKIISHLQARALRLEGFAEGLPISSVETQLHNMMSAGQAGHEEWFTIHVKLTISDVRKQFREVRDEIEDSALTLSIALNLRAQDQKTEARPPRLKKRVHKFNKRGVLSSDESDTSVQRVKKHRGQNLPTTPTKKITAQPLTPNSDKSANTSRRIQRKSLTHLIGEEDTPIFRSTTAVGNEDRSSPRLLYRWYSSQSNGLNTANELRAGKFLDLSQNIPLPEWDLKSVSNHLIPETLPSPYISFRTNLLPCLFKAIKEDRDAKACIAVIDVQKVRDTSKRWGDSALYPCPLLVKQFDLKLGKKQNYRGRGEWLVYGENLHGLSFSFLTNISRQG